MFAGLKSSFGQVEVRSGRGRDEDSVNFGIRVNSITGIDCNGLRKVLFDKMLTLCARINDIFDRAVRQGGEISEQIGAPVAASKLG